MAFRTTAQLGPQLDDKFTGLPHWDSHLGVGRGASFVAEPSYKLGDTEFGSDGAEYRWVKASATIAATPNGGTQVVITYPAYTVATGTGGFYTQPGVAYAAGDFMHVRRGAHNAVPA